MIIIIIINNKFVMLKYCVALLPFAYQNMFQYSSKIKFEISIGFCCIIGYIY